MNESATHAAIEAIARNSYGRLIAYIAARSGDVVGAEDALGDAIAVALERWPRDGVPQKPEAWLLHAARNRVIDAARRHQVRQNAESFLRQIAEEAQAVANTPSSSLTSASSFFLSVHIRRLMRMCGRH